MKWTFYQNNVSIVCRDLSSIKSLIESMAHIKFSKTCNGVLADAVQESMIALDKIEDLNRIDQNN